MFFWHIFCVLLHRKSQTEDGWMYKMCDFRDRVLKSCRIESVNHPSTSVTVYVRYADLNVWMRRIFHSTFLNIQFSHLLLWQSPTPPISISISVCPIFSLSKSLCLSVCLCLSLLSLFSLFSFCPLYSLPFVLLSLFPSVCLSSALMTAATHDHTGGLLWQHARVIKY